MLLLGYFEGPDPERAMAWRAADSLSLQEFLDVALQDVPPDHSTVSCTRRRLGVSPGPATVSDPSIPMLPTPGIPSGTSFTA